MHLDGQGLSSRLEQLLPLNSLVLKEVGKGGTSGVEHVGAWVGGCLLFGVGWGGMG